LRTLYQTYGPSRFAETPEFKGQRPVTEEDVEHYRDRAESESETEARAAREWLEDWERWQTRRA
jgi:hypothetical protein